MNQAVNGLYRIPCRIGSDKPLYQHVLANGDTVLWIDAGIASTPEQDMFPYWHRLAGEAVAEQTHLLVITHADVDHYGGMAAMRNKLPFLTAMAHIADVPWIADTERIIAERYNMHAADGMGLTPERIAQLKERSGGGGRVDTALSGGETLQLDEAGQWRLIHTPGHTPGHLMLWEENAACAVIGDAALGRGLFNTTGKLVAPPPYYDCAAYRQTIETIRELQPDIVYTSHFPVMEGAAIRRFLNESLDMMRQLDQTLRLLPKCCGYSLGELCLETGSRLGYWPETAWAGLSDPLSAHLQAMFREGAVRVEVENGRRQYYFQ
ncbi:MBL fold metallo-hydrolase [Paenibacillus thalictri]|uniref:MBL fold metallo-hydrolase n=1 Tax=Paenibacillus thalictri TaxID=2527873 RepID=A0A4Q9DKP7_9BACL|nr:MBL fold metallo-hydrolase [Paenibacillus thalictri]TBL73290.1 MBL fold metallo-hydrolase [Paenibacillus thalictri]